MDKMLFQSLLWTAFVWFFLSKFKTISPKSIRINLLSTNGCLMRVIKESEFLFMFCLKMAEEVTFHDNYSTDF